MRRFVLAAGLAVLAGCTITAPVTGELSTGEPISGVAKASMSGDGQVEVAGQGVDCSGTYNAFSKAQILTVPLSCEGGVAGLAQVERSKDLMSGTGEFELDDGTTGTFAYAVE